METRRFRAIARTAVALMMLAAVACDGDTSQEATPRPETPSETISAKDFDPDNFDDPTTIDNEFFPMQPGTQFTWEGHATEGGERVRRGVVFTVTDLTKVIDGVRTLVAWDRDYDDGGLAEGELAILVTGSRMSSTTVENVQNTPTGQERSEERRDSGTP